MEILRKCVVLINSILVCIYRIFIAIQNHLDEEWTASRNIVCGKVGGVFDCRTLAYALHQTHTLCVMH